MSEANAGPADDDAAPVPANASRRAFKVRGVVLEVPGGMLNAALATSLEKGRYEAGLANAVEELLRPEDVYFEIGGGIGFLSTIAWRIVRDEARIHVYEANPKLLPIIRRNWKANGASGNVVNCLLGAGPRDERPFHVARAFWASSADIAYAGGRTIKVPQRDFLQQLDKKVATFLLLDIEGGERDLLDKVLPPQVRAVVAAYHARIVGREMVESLWRHLEEQGFRLDSEVSDERIRAYVRPVATAR